MEACRDVSRERSRLTDESWRDWSVGGAVSVFLLLPSVPAESEKEGLMLRERSSELLN